MNIFHHLNIHQSSVIQVFIVFISSKHVYFLSSKYSTISIIQISLLVLSSKHSFFFYHPNIHPFLTSKYTISTLIIQTSIHLLASNYSFLSLPPRYPSLSHHPSISPFTINPFIHSLSPPPLSIYPFHVLSKGIRTWSLHHRLPRGPVKLLSKWNA